MLMYYQKERIIVSDKYGDLKYVHCPLDKQWDNLDRLDDMSKYPQYGRMPIERKRYCGSCSSYVYSLDGLSEEQIEGACLTNPDICVHASFPHDAIKFVEEQSDNVTKCPTFRRDYEAQNIDIPEGTPVIKTLRTLAAINDAIDDGSKVLIKPVIDNPEVRQYVRLWEESGHLEKWVDLRSMYRRGDEEPKTGQVLPVDRDVFEEFNLNPYTSPEPFAAYVIPDDLHIGQKVFIADLIESVVGTYLNHGGVTRQQFLFATWNGKDFDLPDFEPVELIG